MYSFKAAIATSSAGCLTQQLTPNRVVIHKPVVSFTGHMRVCTYKLANFMIVINTRASSTKTLARYGQQPITAEMLARSRPFDLFSCHSDSLIVTFLKALNLADEDWVRQKS